MDLNALADCIRSTCPQVMTTHTGPLPEVSFWQGAVSVSVSEGRIFLFNGNELSHSTFFLALNETHFAILTHAPGGGLEEFKLPIDAFHTIFNTTPRGENTPPQEVTATIERVLAAWRAGDSMTSHMEALERLTHPV